jgi:hypothetical protein
MGGYANQTNTPPAADQAGAESLICALTSNAIDKGQLSIVTHFVCPTSL